MASCKGADSDRVECSNDALSDETEACDVLAIGAMLNDVKRSPEFRRFDRLGHQTNRPNEFRRSSATPVRPFVNLRF